MFWILCITEDIQLWYDEDGTLTASDGEIVWKGKEFYEFLLQEAITFEEDGSFCCPDRWAVIGFV